MMKFKLRSLIKVRVKGGALYISMMVGIVISVLLSMFILLAKFNQRQITNYVGSSQLYSNLKSALQIAQSDYFTEDKNNRWIKNENNDDSIKIKRSYWGAYYLIGTETKNRHQFLSHVRLYGSTMSSDTGLVVAENNRPLGLTGQVVFKANCYLSSAGIKPAFIEGQSYSGNGNNNAYIKKSPMQIPSIDESFSKGISFQQDQLITSNDSLVSAFSNYIAHSFKFRTVVIEASGKLSGLTLKNNIKIVGANEISVDSSCHFENVLIIAKKVRFKHGFKGSVHVIASDSIICEKENVFEFPSSFVLKPSDNNKLLSCIIIGEKSIFNGGMVAFSSNSDEGSDVFIKLNATSEVNGYVYSSDYLHLEGKLNANVFCGRLLLKTPSAVYENHMMACEINPAKYSHILSVPSVCNKNGSLLLSKNLGG